MGYIIIRKEYINVMRYNNNDDIVALIDNYLNINGIKKTFLAERMGITRQRLNSIFQKKNINLDDLKQIADALGLDVEINLVERNKKRLSRHDRNRIAQEAFRIAQTETKDAIRNETLKAIGKAREMGIRHNGDISEFYTRYQGENANHNATLTMYYYTNLMDFYQMISKQQYEEEDETASEPPAPKEAEQSEADGMESKEMK